MYYSFDEPPVVVSLQDLLMLHLLRITIFSFLLTVDKMGQNIDQPLASINDAVNPGTKDINSTSQESGAGGR